MARVAHALSSARGESHGPAARGAGGSIPHKNPPFRPSGRIPVRDAKRRGRRDARSGREKRGARKKGFARGPSSKRRPLYHRTWGFGVAHGAPHRDRCDPFVPIGARGVGPLARGFSTRGAHRRPFDVADSPSGRNIQKSCWQQARAKRPEVGRSPGCRRFAGGRTSFRTASGIGLKTVSVPTTRREPKRTNSLQNVRKSRHDIQKVGRDFPSQRTSINHRREFEGLSGGRSGTFFAFGKPFFVPSRPYTDS